MRSFSLNGIPQGIIAIVLLAAVSTPASAQHRSAWTSSKVYGSPDPAKPFTTTRLFPGVTFRNPVDIQAVPGSPWWVVAEQKGGFYAIDGSQSSPNKHQIFNLYRRDLFAVLSFAFDPNFEENRYVYFMSSLKSGTGNGLRLQRYRCTKDPMPRVISNTGLTIFALDAKVHNGCCIKFGPDGYLYMGMGDGSMGSPADPYGLGQRIDDLRACVLRIDVRESKSGAPYKIPPDNPFVRTQGARGEVWAFGLRNPWRMEFAPGTNDLWVGDVGWEMFETLHCVRAGSNAGWSIQEGSQPVFPQRKLGPAPITPPIIEHSHLDAASITGGVFYGGSQHELLRDAYVYGDYVTGKIWGLRRENDQNTWHQQIADTSLRIVSFFQDARNRVIVLDYASGGLHQLIPNPEQQSTAVFPVRLSETGLFASTESLTPAAGVVPFALSAPMWQDGTQASYHVAVPGTQTITLKKAGNGFPKIWGSFPNGTVLVKTISVLTDPKDETSRKRLETQILHHPGKKRRGSSEWFGYSYVWDDQGIDAVLAPAEGAELKFEAQDDTGSTFQQTHTVASRTQCFGCHNAWTGYRLGFTYRQLAGKKSALQSTGATEFDRLRRIGIVNTTDPNLTRLARLADPHGSSGSLSERARSYLHVNCANCHQAGGGGSGEFDLRYELSLNNSKLLSAEPTKGSFGIPDAKLIKPGDPASSVVLYRMAKVGPGRMPHYGSKSVDREGLKLIRSWIESLQPNSQPNTKLKLAKFQLNSKSTEIDAKLAARVTTTRDALELVDVIDSGEVTSAERAAIVDVLLGHESLAIRDLFQAYRSTGDREPRLGEVVDAAALLQMEGDAERGRDLLMVQSTLSCKSCHVAGETGSLVGPDLKGVGKRLDRRQLVESILQPSKTIDDKYRGRMVETVDGQVVIGLVEHESDESLRLRTADNKEVQLVKADIERDQPATRSVMPDYLWKDLTAQQFADIIEYLVSLK